MKRISHEKIQKSARKLIFTIFFLVIGIVIFALIISEKAPLVSSQSVESQIDSAIYKQEEFFGSRANVPLPTVEAYQNLQKIGEGNNPILFQKLAELAEKLGKFEEAERNLQKLNDLEKLAEFYQRRGDYAKEAETLNQILQKEKRTDIFKRLIELARRHELNQYLEPQFFQQIAEVNENAFPILEKVVDELIEEKQTDKALIIIRNYKSKYPEKMLEKEVALLNPQEAERVYRQSFNPFWSDSVAENFYQFLDDNDRLHAYERELKQKFAQNPANYETAIRLIHYRKYRYGETMPIILRLDAAKKAWKAEELLTIARFLLAENNGDLATKYLYSLNVRQDFTPEMRGQISYQIFKTLCDAENERLSITKGNLSFYRDVATADTRPGITTGVLSLLFSDINPNRELLEKEQVANKYFNRAMAYRILQTYKKEFPASPEIGQMFLDLISLYTKAKQTEVAEKLLSEFIENSDKSNDFPRVAFNLADAFVLANKSEKEREIYQKALDYLGKQGKFRLVQKIAKVEDENTVNNSNENGYGYEEENKYTDLLGEKREKIVYETVLIRLVNSLAKDKETAKILEVYTNEIAKYPKQEWLYEQRLEWLEQTNLFDEQLRSYNEAIDKFQTRSWQDKLARWFIRQKRSEDFAQFSQDLVGKLNDQEIENYLIEFNGNFDTYLRFKLNESARQRFPHNISFVKNLLNYYKTNHLDSEWKKLASEYYFESPEIREEFLNVLAEKGELQKYLVQENDNSLIYQLFKADAYIRLSRFEEALELYRKLNEVYPNDEKISERLINLTRSFGQKDLKTLAESAKLSRQKADFEPSNAVYRIRSGDLQAEIGNYKLAKAEWQKLLQTGKGSNDVYLETATIFWDYFQYDDTLEIISEARHKSNNNNLYALEAGVIFGSLHQDKKAIAEYVKAFGEDESQNHRAFRGLLDLPETDETLQLIDAEFKRQIVGENSSWKAFGYADFARQLAKSASNYDETTREKTSRKALNILDSAIAQTKDENFLHQAKYYFDGYEEKVLKRLGEIAQTPRKSISYSLQIADSYQEKGQPAEAQKIVANLLKKYPNNYGLIAESDRFYWSLGKSAESLQVLRSGYERSDHKEFGLPLANRLISLGRLAESEPILVTLHQENLQNSEVVETLASLYAREGKTNDLKRIFGETAKEIRLQDIEPKEVEAEIADVRRLMIKALTQAKDYRSAIEQHIEIINREPDNEENVKNAISYVKCYGGGDVLLNYYQKTADEAFKNYRWNVVLAEIFEATGDKENAIKNYLKAIDSQPEMPELYAEVARLETDRKNYEEALKNLNQVIKLSGENKELIKQKVKLLQLLNKSDEVQTELAKLPKEVQKIEDKKNPFEQAQVTKMATDYRQAYEVLLENPLKNDFKGEDITGYVQTLRQEENLDAICERLFSLRQIFIDEANRTNSEQAGEARKRLQILENALSQSVGNIAKTVGTNEELANLHNQLEQKITNSQENGNYNNFNFLRDFSTKIGFGDLVEKILQKRANRDDLISFYNERGIFGKVLELAEAKGDVYLIAENARLIGNREKEVAALRNLYNSDYASEAEVRRFLEIVDHTELESLTKQHSPNQLRLVNFLLEKGEKQLAHQAIESSNFSKVWKISRHAETSLAFKEFGGENECYFCEALNFAPIGELIQQQPEQNQQLIGTDWFTLAREYGEWLDEQKESSADKFLAARIEFLAKDSNEQAKLGDYYLAKNQLPKVLQHFQLSLELDEENLDSQAKLGEIYWRLGEKEKAEKMLEKVFKSDPTIYLQTMKRIGLQSLALEKILPKLAQQIEDGESELDTFGYILEEIESEKEKADFFIKICRQSESKEFAEKLIEQNLIDKKYQQPFYEFIIAGKYFDETNYRFAEISAQTLSNEDAEEIYDHETNFKEKADDDSDSTNKKSLEWEEKYLNFLLENKQNTEAKNLIIQLESLLDKKFSRPNWLRVAHLQISGGNLQKFVGVEVTANITDAKPPSIERLGMATAMLKKSGREAEVNDLRFAFYARMLAMQQFETPNFIGLAREFFKRGENEKGLQILQISTDLSNEERQRELTEMSDIKAFAPKNQTNIETKKSIDTSQVWQLAAETCEEFGQIDLAIAFRQKLLEISPFDAENKLKLAEILPKEKALELLQNVVNDRNSLRKFRWQAILKLHELGENIEIPNVAFDAYSQYYNGLLSPNESYFFNSLVADKDLEVQTLQQLARVYAANGKPFATLKIAEIDKNKKDDDFLTVLSQSAENIGEFGEAIEFEQGKKTIDDLRIAELKAKQIERNKKATEFVVSAENTREL